MHAATSISAPPRIVLLPVRQLSAQLLGQPPRFAQSSSQAGLSCFAASNNCLKAGSELSLLFEKDDA